MLSSKGKKLLFLSANFIGYSPEKQASQYCGSLLFLAFAPVALYKPSKEI